MDRLEEHLASYRFNRWATERMFEFVAPLSSEELDRDVGSSYPSIRGTLVHMLAAEWIWLRRWKGESPVAMPAGWDGLDLDGIRSAWADVETERAAWLETLAPDDLDRTISYRNIRGDAFMKPVWQMLRHVVNHSSYHRGQITTMVRQLGAGAVGTDMILFFDE